MSGSERIVRSFDQELKRLKTMLTTMGGITENQVAQATQAVLRHDTEAALATIGADPRVDDLERDVEHMAIRMLALRQPMADDLREIVGALKISAALERVGDYATNMAKRSMVLNQSTHVFNAQTFNLSGFAQMSDMVQRNLKLIVDALTENDTEKALLVWNSDQAIDDVYNSIFRALVTYMMEDPRSITPCTHLLFVAKNLERIGDKATNIAEILYYSVTGEPLAGPRPKGEPATTRPASY